MAAREVGITLMKPNVVDTSNQKLQLSSACQVALQTIFHRLCTMGERMKAFETTRISFLIDMNDHRRRRSSSKQLKPFSSSTPPFDISLCVV